MDSQNYDIALLQLDREVLIGSDMSPVCLDQSLTKVGQEHEPDENPTVYISGFGITFYRNNRTAKVPECSTNHFLPRPYHSKNISL